MLLSGYVGIVSYMLLSAYVGIVGILSNVYIGIAVLSCIVPQAEGYSEQMEYGQWPVQIDLKVEWNIAVLLGMMWVLKNVTLRKDVYRVWEKPRIPCVGCCC